MGHRISKVITKTGDEGYTGLANGTRLPKTSMRIDAMGDVDELNSAIGLALTKLSPMTMGMTLLRNEVQHRLFDIGAELSMPGTNLITESDVCCLEECADAINETLLPLKNFIIPGGTQAAARLHLARAICRRAERALWRVAEHSNTTGMGSDPYIYGTVNPASLHYLNRLSDLLFIMARQECKSNTVLWNQLDPRIEEDEED